MIAEKIKSVKWSEDKLNDILTEPSERLITDMKKIEGNIIFLGAGGKMGPTLCLLAKRAAEKAGTGSKITAVSRFTDPIAVNLLKDNGINIISADLAEPTAFEKLPDMPNVIYMLGRKFGTDGQEHLTWATNAGLSAKAAERYKNSRIVVFSSGNIYPNMPTESGGATEETPPNPTGEYAMSCVARERLFEYAAHTYGTKIALYRLNYAIDLRYGVLFDVAEKVLSGKPISLATANFNCIWQGDANEAAIRCLIYAESDVFRLNVTGPETASVGHIAERFGRIFGKTPVFTGEPSGTSNISNSGKMAELLGYPAVSLETLIKWQAEWIMSGGRSLGKATHFEERRGSY